MADKEYCGKAYRQVSRKLSIHRGTGSNGWVSVRPYQGSGKDGTLVYLDSDEAPTLITFAEDDQVDVPSLLALGAIREYAPPKGKAKEVSASVEKSVG